MGAVRPMPTWYRQGTRGPESRQPDGVTMAGAPLLTSIPCFRNLPGSLCFLFPGLSLPICTVRAGWVIPKLLCSAEN